MTETINQIHRCEVCGNDKLESVLNLGAHPMCDDLIAFDEDRTCEEYPIEILFCDRCVTAHQRFQVPKQHLFPTTYHYRSRFTADVLNGMKSLVDACVKRHRSLDGKLVLDVGCNDGSLLGYFQAAGAKTVGIEPTGAYQDAENKGHSIYNAYLDPTIAKKVASEHGKPDFIVFTNVFAHIEDLTAVIDSLKCLMSDNTVLLIENHYLGGVLSGNQFDTFYHEHPRTYSCTSFFEIAKSLGMQLTDVVFPSRYGGNIRVEIAKSGTPLDAKLVNGVLEKERDFGRQIRAMQTGITRWKLNKRAELESYVTVHGKLHAKAFPGRAAILVKMLDLDSDLVETVYEKPGSMKIGHYMPGTRIPIQSDDDLKSLEQMPTIMLNLAWHISSEIRGYLSDQGYRGKVVDILTPQDFEAA